MKLTIECNNGPFLGTNKLRLEFADNQLYVGISVDSGGMLSSKLTVEQVDQLVKFLTGDNKND